MSHVHSPLRGVLHEHTTSETQAEILRHLWPNTQTAFSQPGSSDWNAYFAYYTEECKAALVGEGEFVAARTHQDLLNIARLVQNGLSENEVKQEICQTLTQQQRSPEDENRMLDGSIRLAARLSIMVNIGPLPSEILATIFLPWTHGSLQDAVHNYFNDVPEADPSSDLDIIRMDLTARNVDNNSGIEIIPTDNLLDHLRLIQGDKKLCVFHHVAFLKRMRDIESPMFPDGFFDESLDTITLLFPEEDRKVRAWFEVESKTNPHWARIDSTLIRCGRFGSEHPARRLKHYKFWRDRLVTLQETADEALTPSKALLKALRDNKKEERWLNSWVAIVAIGLALFFGLIQSIEGAIQVYKAYHPTKG